MIKNHVVDLKPAKKLKKYFPKLNGINPFFNWVYDETWNEEKGFYDDWFVEPRSTTAKKGFPAPILSEMLELLPKEIEGHELDLNTLEYMKWGLDSNGGNAHKSLGYDTDRGCMPYFKMSHDPLTATAAARLYMWLVDNKYVEVE